MKGSKDDTVVFELDATGWARSLSFPAERMERVAP